MQVKMLSVIVNEQDTALHISQSGSTDALK